MGAAKEEVYGYYLRWCRQWHRDPEDVGSMVAYEEEFLEELGERGEEPWL